MEQGRGHRVLSRRLADTCGTKLSGNRVNESWRASGAAGLVCLSVSPVMISGSISRPDRKRWRGQRVGISAAARRTPAANHLQLDRRELVSEGRSGIEGTTGSVFNFSGCSFPHWPVIERLPWCASTP